MHTRRISDAQAGAQIAWVGDAIKHQQKRRFFQRIQYVIQMNGFLTGIDAGNYPLMACVGRHTFDARVLGTNGFVKSGLGRLVLNISSNSYTGAISYSFMSITNFGSPAPL